MYIKKACQKMDGDMSKLAGGDLSFKVCANDSSDEFGRYQGLQRQCIRA